MVDLGAGQLSADVVSDDLSIYKRLLWAVFSVTGLPGPEFHYKRQTTAGIRTGRNELLQVDSASEELGTRNNNLSNYLRGRKV